MRPSRTRVNIFIQGLAGQGLTYMHSLDIFRHLKVELLTQFPPSNAEKYLYLTPQSVSGKVYMRPSRTRVNIFIQGLAGQGLTYMHSLAIFRHLKVELLTQFPPSNNEK